MVATLATVKRRVAALEASAGGGECEVCGFDGDYSKLHFVTSSVDRGEAPPEKDCSRCGRPLRISISLGWGGR